MLRLNSAFLVASLTLAAAPLAAGQFPVEPPPEVTIATPIDPVLLLGLGTGILSPADAAALAKLEPGSQAARDAVANLISAIVKGIADGTLRLPDMTPEQRLTAAAYLTRIEANTGSTPELTSLIATLKNG